MDEDRALYIWLIITGGPPAAIAVAHDTALGATPTLAACLLLTGLLGFIRGFGRERSLLPRAHWRKRRR